MTPHDFLNLVCAPEAHYYLWELATRQSFWFAAPSDGAAKAEAVAGDLYWGCGGTLQPGDAAHRVKAEQVDCITCLWCDVDVLGDGHAEKSYPPTFDDALKLIAEPEPSILIHSGGGWQAYWLLKEPWFFEDQSDRAAAQDLLARWQRMIRYRAAARSWTIDATHDLARIMRLPGTWNCKREPKRPVEVKKESSARYNPSDLIDYLDELGIPSEPERLRTAVSNDIEISPSAVVDPAMVEALCTNIPQFHGVWHRTTRIGASSPSEYDMSIASYAVQAGLTDQQVVDLLIAHRRMHGDKCKMHRKYYELTIGKARGSNDKPLPNAPEAPKVQPLGGGATRAPGQMDDTTRGAAIDTLRQELGIPLLRIVRSTGERPSFRLVTEWGDWLIGSTATLTNQRLFCLALAEGFKTYPDPMKAQRWAKISRMMLDVSIDEVEGETAADRIKRYLAQYLTSTSIYSSYDEARASRSMTAAHVDQDRILISVARLCSWLATNERDKPAQNDINQMLHQIGAVQCAQRAKSSTYRFWALPPDLFDPQTYRGMRE